VVVVGQAREHRERICNRFGVPARGWPDFYGSGGDGAGGDAGRLDTPIGLTPGSNSPTGDNPTGTGFGPTRCARAIRRPKGVTGLGQAAGRGKGAKTVRAVDEVWSARMRGAVAAFGTGLFVLLGPRGSQPWGDGYGGPGSLLVDEGRCLPRAMRIAFSWKSRAFVRKQVGFSPGQVD